MSIASETQNVTPQLPLVYTELTGENMILCLKQIHATVYFESLTWDQLIALSNDTASIQGVHSVLDSKKASAPFHMVWHQANATIHGGNMAATKIFRRR